MAMEQEVHQLHSIYHFLNFFFNGEVSMLNHKGGIVKKGTKAFMDLAKWVKAKGLHNRSFYFCPKIACKKLNGNRALV
jgi:hypothetical protein